MIKILNASQVRELDAYTIANEPVSSIALMERACDAFAEWFTTHVRADNRVVVVCGTGNNGGDGLGVARKLKESGYHIRVCIIKGANETDDFKQNRARLQNTIAVKEISDNKDIDDFNDADVIIDAIFGSGLSRPIEGVHANVITKINKSDATKIAIDIPSGLMADSPSSGAIVKADYTIAFQLPKLAFLIPENFQFTGQWFLVDIGLHRSFIKETDTPYCYIQLKDARRILKPRRKFDHKGTYGHALIVAGSHGKMGAAILATRAALRAGTGLVSAHVPSCGYDIMQVSTPEAMVFVDKDEKVITAIGTIEKFSAVGIGPGLGQDKQTATALRKLLEQSGKPLVLDADALNLLAANRDMLHIIPPNSILTPHPKEFERLAGESKNSFDRLDRLRSFARQIHCFVILKGAFTAIACPDGNVFFNGTGNPGMATGGTGDVLTGILTGLLAQGYEPQNSCLLGVYLHGLAGDFAAEQKGLEALIAGDLIESLSTAYKKLNRQ
ncbi:MAG TPA: NAD(P)H-hydrate dehydratase [Chryseosolibacter sp.]|nr:NAD(P)H-hydrate dehydratase [Chryseosolibacter sp.]